MFIARSCAGGVISSVAPKAVRCAVSCRLNSTFEGHDGAIIKAHGLGVGNIRTGLGAVHRVKVVAPDFLAAPKTVAIIGAPITYGQPFAGTDDGPKALRDAGLHEALTKLGWRVKDLGDLDFDPPTHKDAEFEGPGMCMLPLAVGRANEKLATAVKKQAENGKFVLTLGGDHSSGVGNLAGIMSVRPNSGVIWVDAHADINTPESSPTGNMHGMPLAFMLGLVDITEVPGHSWLKDVPRMEPEQLVYIGLRDVDRGERHIIERLGIKAFTMFHVDMYGIGKVMEMALDHLDGRPLHMSYDIDACDPVIAPATGTVVRGGLTYREAHFIAEAAAATARLGSFDIVEVNPTLHAKNSTEDVNLNMTSELGLALIASALGNRIL